MKTEEIRKRADHYAAQLIEHAKTNETAVAPLLCVIICEAWEEGYKEARAKNRGID